MPTNYPVDSLDSRPAYSADPHPSEPRASDPPAWLKLANEFAARCRGETAFVWEDPDRVEE